ncbi:MAG: hypothetical protein WAK48_34025, partial [Candidatus Acidiferrum sp.]
MRRRDFLQSAAGAAALVAVPRLLRADTPAPAAPARDPLGDIEREMNAENWCGDSYWCDCGLVRYVKKPEGHFAADHMILSNGQKVPMSYGLHRQHLHLHREKITRERLYRFENVNRNFSACDDCGAATWESHSHGCH